MRVVITGMGAITSLGHDPDTFWNNMKEGRTAAGPLVFPDYPDFRNIACLVQDFDPKTWMDRREAHF